MVKMRTQLGSSGEDDQPVPDAPRRKSRRRRETEMRMKRERKSRATLRGTLRGSMTIEELRVLTNQLKSGDDGTNAEPPLLTRKSSSSSSFYIPPPPPLPPPAVVPVSAKNRYGCCSRIVAAAINYFVKHVNVKPILLQHCTERGWQVGLQYSLC